MTPALQIRRALPHEADALTAITLQAKAHWPYPAAQLDAWRDALTVSAADIERDPTFVAELDRERVGFYALATLADAAWPLEHLWVLPRFMGRGIGRALLQHARDFAASHGVDAITIDADPYAEPFYERCGAQRVGTIAAPIDGVPDRVRPQLVLHVLGEPARR